MDVMDISDTVSLRSHSSLTPVSLQSHPGHSPRSLRESRCVHVHVHEEMALHLLYSSLSAPPCHSSAGVSRTLIENMPGLLCQVLHVST